MRLWQGRIAEVTSVPRRFLGFLPGAAGVDHAIMAAIYSQLDMRERAQEHLDQVDPSDRGSLPRNGFWFGALQILARSAFLLGDVGKAEMLLELLTPTPASTRWWGSIRSVRRRRIALCATMGGDFDQASRPHLVEKPFGALASPCHPENEHLACGFRLHTARATVGPMTGEGSLEMSLPPDRSRRPWWRTGRSRRRRTRSD